MGTGGKLLRRIRASVDDRPTGFVWVEDHALAGTGYPASRAQVGWLARNGVSSLLSLTEDPLPEGWVKGMGIEYGHVPMKDHEPPSLASLRKAVEFVQGQTSAHRPTAVHCLAGEGRTGCVLSAYLIRVKGMGADEAMAALRAVKPEFVERNQEKAVRDFATSERSAGRG